MSYSRRNLAREIRADGTIRRLTNGTYPKYLLASNPTGPEIQYNLQSRDTLTD